MLIDANMVIGHYPFRKSENKTAAELVKLMDQYSVDKAVVSSLNGIYYRDVMEGNYELLDEIAPFKDRLIPACVINPVYADVLTDLNTCLKLGFRAIRLFPRQHGYPLDGPEAVAVLKAAAEYNLPVQLPVYLDDPRGRHPMDYMDPIGVDEIVNAAMLSLDTDIMINNGNHQSFAPKLSCLIRKGRICYDIGRTDCMNQTSFTELLEAAGADHIVFGTGAPLQYIAVQQVKLAFMSRTAGLNEQQLEKIKSENAKEFFHL